MIVVSSLFVVSEVHAAATLTVDLATAYRPATHVGNGSLYGVTEKVPADADLERLVGALHPRMFTDPASSDPGTQQPGVSANAIKVAARLAPLGGSVTVRLADWLSGFYTFSSMTDWLNKVGTTIAAKKAANLNNVYAYELWNEPNGTWTNGGDTNAVPGGAKTVSFNALWKQTYDKVRQLDPDVKITGPSLSYMDPDFFNGFLTYCKANNCLPDIIGWHEGTNIESDVASYRSLEKQLGVGPLAITINEYSGSGRAKDEGRPGASIPLIAQLERAGVDTACISWWTPDSIAGHLGSLLASDTQTNGGWFVYKWYGDMTGTMVTTTSSLAKDGKNLDGLASLDTSARNASVILGGVSDGTIHVVVKGFASAPFFASTVHAVVDHTSWTGRGGVVTGTDVVSSADVTIANDQITVSISNVNGDDGYRVSLTQVGGATDGGSVASDGGSPIHDANQAEGGGADAHADQRPSIDAPSGADGSQAGSDAGLEASSLGGTGGAGSGGTGGGSSNPGSGTGATGGTSTRSPGGGSAGCSCKTLGDHNASATTLIVGLGLFAFARHRKTLNSRVPRANGKVAIRSLFCGIASFSLRPKQRTMQGSPRDGSQDGPRRQPRCQTTRGNRHDPKNAMSPPPSSGRSPRAGAVRLRSCAFLGPGRGVGRQDAGILSR